MLGTLELRHHLGVAQRRAGPHHSPRHARTDGKFLEQPLLNLRQAAFDLLERMNQRRDRQHESRAARLRDQGLQARLGKREVADQHPRVRKAGTGVMLDGPPVIDVSHLEAVFANLDVEGSREHGGTTRTSVE
jgi:hypothetical protein